MANAMLWQHEREREPVHWQGPGAAWKRMLEHFCTTSNHTGGDVGYTNDVVVTRYVRSSRVRH